MLVLPKDEEARVGIFGYHLKPLSACILPAKNTYVWKILSHKKAHQAPLRTRFEAGGYSSTRTLSEISCLDESFSNVLLMLPEVLSSSLSSSFFHRSPVFHTVCWEHPKGMHTRYYTYLIWEKRAKLGYGRIDRRQPAIILTILVFSISCF